MLDLPVLQVPTIEVLRSQQADPAALRDLVRSIPDADYEAFIASLGEKEREEHARLLQQVEILRSSGMTPGSIRR